MWWQHSSFRDWGARVFSGGQSVYDVMVFAEGTPEDEIGRDMNGIKDDLFLQALATWGNDYQGRAVIGRWPHATGPQTCVGVAFLPPENNRP